MSQLAATVEPHLQALKAEVQQLAPYIGPVMGRLVVEGLAGKVGTTGNPELDRQLGHLISDLKLASSAVGRTHFAGRTGLPASQYFESLFNAAQTPEKILGILDSVPSYIEGYEAMGKFAPQQPLQPIQPKNGGGVNPPTPKKSVSGGGTIDVLDNTGKKIGTATPEQQKRNSYTPLR
jgi:hypothetical protein